MSSLRRTAFTLCFGVMGIAGCAADANREADLDAAEDDVVGGRIEWGNKYDAVVSIYDLQGASIGSGAFIAPGVVVTAEHLFDARGRNGIEVRRGADSERPNRRYSVKHIEKVTAEGNSSVTGYGADVAFLVLTRKADVTPLPMLDRSLDERDLSTPVRLVAFGQTETTVNGTPGRYRRSAPGRITAVSGRPHADALLPGTLPPASGPELRLGYEAQVEDVNEGFNCSGDSGGPHLGTVNGALTIMALSSAQSIKNNRCVANFTIISSFGPEVQAAKARALAMAPR